MKTMPGMERIFARAQALGNAPPPAAAVPGDLRDVLEEAVKDWMAAPQLPPTTDICQWWNSKEASDCKGVVTFKRYFKLPARRYLAVAGASGRIERLWSDGRRLYSHLRHFLSGNRACQLLRLKSNVALVGMWPVQPV